MEKQLQLKKISFSYNKNKKLISNLNINLTPGKILWLAGNNGLGKSTLFKIIMGVLKADDGKIIINNEDFSNKKIIDRAGRIGLVLQDPDSQIFAPTIYEELLFSPLNLNWKKDKIKARLDQTLVKFELHDLKKLSPMSLNFSERKKISLASIYAMDPSIYLLDEPDSSMDRRYNDLLKKIIQEEAQAGKSFIIISHNYEFMSEVSHEQLKFQKNGSWTLNSIKEALYRDSENSFETDIVWLAKQLKLQNPLDIDSWIKEYQRIVNVR